MGTESGFLKKQCQEREQNAFEHAVEKRKETTRYLTSVFEFAFRVGEKAVRSVV